MRAIKATHYKYNNAFVMDIIVAAGCHACAYEFAPCTARNHTFEIKFAFCRCHAVKPSVKNLNIFLLPKRKSMCGKDILVYVGRYV